MQILLYGDKEFPDSLNKRWIDIFLSLSLFTRQHPACEESIVVRDCRSGGIGSVVYLGA